MAPQPPRRPAPALSAADAMRRMLLEAASDGDLYRFNKLARFLDKGRGRLRETVEAITVETDDEELKGIGALHLAAGNGKLEICRYLVEGLRMDVDTVDRAGRTPLINAIHGKSVDAVKYLLEHGANQDKVDHDGFAPLHSAAGLGFPQRHYNKMVNGMTPLYFAINSASTKCVQLLVQAGAIANGDYFLSSLINAPKNASAECLNCILGAGPGSSWHATNDDEPVDKMKIAVLKSQGSKAVERKDFLSAAEFYSMALELDHEDAALFSNRSLCWLHMGRPLLSLLDALECRKKRPDWSKACYRQGKALMALKDYRGACVSFRCIEVGPREF